jgi:dienelactone hydrolase
MIENIEYTVAGRMFAGLLATPEGTRANHRGVLVVHGGSGLGAHEREKAARFAALGYVALAPDLFGETFGDRARGMAVIGELVTNPGVLRERITAAWSRVAADPGVDPARTVAVGHCFGGLAAFELARSGADVRAVVGLHAGLAAREPARRGEVRARLLACVGANDPFCPREQRAAFEDEMTAAGVDWQLLTLANAKHGFSVPNIDETKQPGCEYHGPSDTRSWRAMLALFDEVLD